MCRRENLPDELYCLIEKRKENSFAFTYENASFLYLTVGYGKQEKDSYVAAVKEIYEVEKGIMVDTILLNESAVGEMQAGEAQNCPYIVIKCEKRNKSVFFF